MTLNSSLYLLLSPVFMVLAVLACTGQLANMQINDAPVYVCPTPAPRATEIMPPPPRVGAGTPQPPPRPTYTPYPTATPYVIRPPQPFYPGDAVFTDGTASAVRARFRLDTIHVQPASPDADGNSRRIVTWSLEVKNVGGTDYEFFPAAQMFVSRVEGEDGVWGAGADAADEAGIPFAYAVYALSPGQAVTVALAAYIPAGDPTRFTYLLDPTQTSTPNTITWTDTRNPHCTGDVAALP